ncbi:MAG: hypothetical protein HY020_27185 [Burkholderiales bacterium]|nr:hypothetical protein [Burkholderiales bacterium]
MQILTVRLKRVFDVKRSPLAREEATNFSFETDEGQRCFFMQLPGKPRLEAGDVVTAVLAQAGNWQSLRGWKNLSSGEVIVRSDVGLRGWLRLAVVSGLAFAWWRGASTENGRTVLGALLVCCGLLAVVLARQQWQTWQTSCLLSRS